MIFEALYCSYKEFEQLYQKLEIVNFTLSLFHLVLVVILFFSNLNSVKQFKILLNCYSGYRI